MAKRILALSNIWAYIEITRYTAKLRFAPCEVQVETSLMVVICFNFPFTLVQTYSTSRILPATTWLLLPQVLLLPQIVCLLCCSVALKYCTRCPPCTVHAVSLCTVPVVPYCTILLCTVAAVKYCIVHAHIVGAVPSSNMPAVPSYCACCALCILPAYLKWFVHSVYSCPLSA